VHFYAGCTKGTYIRTLGHDLATSLGSTGHLVALRREAIGEARVDKAWDVQVLVDKLFAAIRWVWSPCCGFSLRMYMFHSVSDEVRLQSHTCNRNTSGDVGDAFERRGLIRLGARKCWLTSSLQQSGGCRCRVAM
jgi:tRNA U55 pseudouridine synthase TruB